MKFRFFTINAMQPEEGQDELNRICAEQRVVTVDRQFVANGQNSFWAVCATIASKPESLPAALTKQAQRSQRVNGSGSSRVDYKEVLNEEDFARFADLRQWRKEVAQAEGVPLYAVFTNEQLAAIVQQRVESLAALGEIEGIGPARLERYGAGVLERLQIEARARTGQQP